MHDAPLTTTSSTPKWVTCPACRQPALYAPDNPYRPFCGKLCRATDLGRWAEEEFRVAAPPTDTSAENIE